MNECQIVKGLILVCPDYEGAFILDTDASDTGIAITGAGGWA